MKILSLAVASFLFCGSAHAKGPSSPVVDCAIEANQQQALASGEDILKITVDRAHYLRSLMVQRGATDKQLEIADVWVQQIERKACYAVYNTDFGRIYSAMSMFKYFGELQTMAKATLPKDRKGD